jgi:hypothetical protein
MHPTDPTILWRLTRGSSVAHATVLPGEGVNTLTWFIDGMMDRVENYESMDLALARADDVRGLLVRDGWTQP